MIEEISNLLPELWKWFSILIEVLCVLCFTIPKIRTKIKSAFQSFIGYKEIKTDIIEMKEQVKKIETTLNTHLVNDKDKLEAQMFNLKESLMRSFHFYIDRGYITLEERNTLQDVYKSYRKFNGNGVFQEFWEEKILKLPDKPPIK